MYASTLQRLSVLAVAGALLLAVRTPMVRAVAVTFQVTENQIVSLTNSPALLELHPSVNEAGRLLLRMELEFTNDCYAGVGANTRLLQKPAGAIMVVSQNVPADGCPEIFRPVRRTLVLRMPQNLLGQNLFVIARPAPKGVVRTVKLGGAQGAFFQADETRALRASPRAVPTIQSVRIQAAGAKGYIVTGKVRIAAQCAGSDLGLQILEVPDAEGVPKNDVVLITSPARCTELKAGPGTDISVHVDTPQPRRGRTVIMVNEASPGPIPLPG